MYHCVHADHCDDVIRAIEAFTAAVAKYDQISKLVYMSMACYGNDVLTNT
jgi:hypothetical protein